MKKALLSVLIILISAVTSFGKDGYKRNPAVDIRNYTFSISVSDSSNMIYGKSTVIIDFKGEVASLEFDLKNIKQDGTGMVVDSVIFSKSLITWQHINDKIMVHLDDRAKNGEQGSLRIVYHGVPSDGLIISNNKFGGRTFFSDNWPDRARNYLPCTDHPSDKATVDFIIKAPSHYEVVASGHLVEESHLPGEYKLTNWKEDIPLSTKVMAFGAADFDIQLAGTPGNVPVWTYVFKENRNEGFSDYSLAVKPMEFYSRLVGSYPYEKLANVQSKTIFGGLENAGCIFYAENSVSGTRSAAVEGLLAHEIAHQWFGNSVTENDWHHIWLSEGFATYFTSLYKENKYGKKQLDADMVSARDVVINYYKCSPHPVIDTTITDFMDLLSANSYQKGAWVLHMLRREVGDKNFLKGIRLYYERYRNGNALTDDFKNVMEEVSRKDLDDFFKQWLYVAGQPDLKITSKPSVKSGTTEVIIEQKQEYLFRFPLELKLVCQEGERIEKIKITDRITKLMVKTKKLNEIISDPEVNLLFTRGKE